MPVNGTTQATKSVEPALKQVGERVAIQVARLAEELADTALAARDSFSIQRSLIMLRARSKIAFAKNVLAEVQCRMEGSPCSQKDLPLP